MCGIVGALALCGDHPAIDVDYIATMRDTMSHRGPDGCGIWISPDRRAGLGHLRLAIVDLSDAAGQPMANEDGTLQIVFNGEIYNHRQIRDELMCTGRHTWKTDHSDTEVILHAYEEWGTRCLDRLRGMFAFAIYDVVRGRLLMVRDRIGVKPLYYMQHHGRLVFASEIKALLADPQVTPAVDESAFFNYLSFLAVPAPDTLFAGIKKLPGGHYLCATIEGKINIQRWWDVWDHTRPLVGLSDGELAEHVQGELRTSVHLRKESDVPVGVFLSGGIDSSINAAFFSEGERRPVSTFTIGYEGNNRSCPNECAYARQMADHIGACHFERLLRMEDLLEFLPRMVHLQDEPIADPVCVPLHYVCKLAIDAGVKVCQVGEGADELFYGYPGWKHYLQMELWSQMSIPSMIRQLGLGAYGLMRGTDSFRYEWLRRSARGLPVFWGGAEAFPEHFKRSLLAPRLRQAFAAHSSWDILSPIHQHFLKRAWEPSNLHWMTYLDLQIRIPELLLMRVDKMSMGVSLETRVPFLDHKLVELALSIPAIAKTRGHVFKRILKNAVQGYLPENLISRPKQGFGVPLHEWFLGGLGATARRDIRIFCGKTDYFDPAAVGRFLLHGSANQIWFLYNFVLWWKHYVAKEK